jgi:hypothetical protein
LIGICGRGVLIDLVKFYTESGTKPLPYDPWTSHSIPVKDIEAAAKEEHIEFRQGDILLLRLGFMLVSAPPYVALFFYGTKFAADCNQRLKSSSQAERGSLANKLETL